METPIRIAIVEDNEKIRRELSELLGRYQYQIYAPDSFTDIVKDVLKARPQLVLLDINLPVYDGYYVCRELRKASSVPVIVVTSRDSDMDELMSMNLGADDFITKPYNTQILLARIASVLKRAYHTESAAQLTHRGLTLDLSRSMARYQGQEVELSKNETRILHLLMKNCNSIISREEIMTDLWQTDEFVDDNTLTVNINRLRKKLESVGLQDYIVTKRGRGYMA